MASQLTLGIKCNRAKRAKRVVAPMCRIDMGRAEYALRLYSEAAVRGISPLRMSLLLHAATGANAGKDTYNGLASRYGATRTGICKTLNKMDDMIEVIVGEDNKKTLILTEKGKVFLERVNNEGVK